MSKIILDEHLQLKNQELQRQALQSQQLQILIQKEISKNKGSISFAQFMDLTLYTPKLGFYNSDSEKFGPKGHFVTAPEISKLFSKCLANQCAEILRSLTLQKGSILELGAGSGVMAKEILLRLEELETLPKYYFIFEVSDALKQKQKQNLSALPIELFSRIHWLDSLPEESFNGVILANEVLDALPFYCFCLEDNFVFERRVKCKKDNHKDKDNNNDNEENKSLFYFENFPITEGVIFREIQKLREKNLFTGIHSFNNNRPYFSEINLQAKTLIQHLCQTLEQGVILMIDYGFSEKEFYHPDRFMGTLMCHYQHMAHADPFLYPGLQDITMHVDFTQIAETGFQAGCDVLGFTNQANFLMNTDLMEMFKGENEILLNEHRTKNPNIRNGYQLSQVIHTLTSQEEMGELFKVLAIGRDIEFPLIGFRTNDLRYYL